MTPLVEREREVAALAALLDALPAGEGRVAWIEGPAGIGKSTLLAEERRHAAEGGAQVLFARGSELEREFPFGVVRQLFEGVVTDPERRERVLAGAAAPAAAVFGEAAMAEGDASFAALHGLFWVALNLAAERPLVLAIDDLHWCDRPSLRFVAYLARRLEGQPILVAATIRTGEPGTDVALLGEIAHDPSTVAVRPVPLSADAVRALVRERLGAEADEPFCAACHAATGGNPLFLRQLLTALEADHVKPDAAHAGVVLEIGPRAVSRTVIMRLARLSEDAIAVARAVAVLSESATLPAVAALTGLSEARVADATGTLARAEILRREAPIAFVHALVRDAVYLELPLGERELQHERAARVLLDAGAPPEQVAAHLLTAPRRGQVWVAEQLREAGRAAVTRGAPESGVAHLRRALEEPAPAAVAAGADARARARRGPDGRARGDRAPHRGLRHARGSGRPHGGRARALPRPACSPARSRRRRRSPSASRPSCRTSRTTCRALAAFDLMLGFFGLEAPQRLRGLEAHQDPPGDSLGAKMLASVASLWWAHTGGHVDECAELALASLAGGELTVADNGLLMMAAMMTLVYGDRPEVDAQWVFAQSEAHKHGSLLGVSAIHLWHGFTLLQYGELAEAADSLRRGQEEFDAWGFGEIASRYTSSFLCRAALERGRIDEARAWLDRSPPLRDENSDGSRYWRATRLMLLLAEGRFAEVLEAFAEYQRYHSHVRAPTSTWVRSQRRTGARPARPPRRGDRAGRGGAGRRAPLGRAGDGRPVAAGRRRACAAMWSCCRRRPTCSSTHTRGSSSPRRSPTSAPRCGASGGRPTPASRSDGRSSWPTRARPKGSSSTCAPSSTRPARGRARRRWAGSTR